MAENSPVESGSLPHITEKDLQEMNQLMADKAYRIKLSGGFMRADKQDKVNPDFVLYTLNDYLGHIQNCVASTMKMLPFGDNAEFIARLGQDDPAGARLVSVICAIDLRRLSSMLTQLQANNRDITVSQLSPFIKLLYQPLIKLYYLGAAGVSREYRQIYAYITRTFVPADPEALKTQVSLAVHEWNYLFEKVFPGLYPLVLRMCAPAMMTSHQLFYANGSKVLAWLGVQPSEVLIVKDLPAETPTPAVPSVEPVVEKTEEEALPDEVREGLDVLEQLFPEAGWNKLETMPDLCPYFEPILQFNDGFTQLAPENPLHQTLILFWILEELFQGLRLIKFEQLGPISAQDDIEDINKILEEWIRYQEAIFDKKISVELKAYTHQIYTQPDFYKTPYGRKSLSNMYTMIKAIFLPYFNVQMYGSVKMLKDDRMPSFFVRVARLRRVLERYHAAILAAPDGSEANGTAVPGVLNPWDIYKFDIANPVSRRLDALCGGKHSRTRTNALLIRYTLAILEVLDWWINDRTSYAYREPPQYLYRTIEPGSAIPAFGVHVRTDVDEIFMKHLKARLVD
jgi:hypothetical protein